MSNDTFRIDHTLCKSETTQLPKQNHSLAIAPTTQTLVRRPQLLIKPQLLFFYINLSQTGKKPCGYTAFAPAQSGKW